MSELFKLQINALKLRSVMDGTYAILMDDLISMRRDEVRIVQIKRIDGEKAVAINPANGETVVEGDDVLCMPVKMPKLSDADKLYELVYGQVTEVIEDENFAVVDIGKKEVTVNMGENKLVKKEWISVNPVTKEWEKKN